MFGLGAFASLRTHLAIATLLIFLPIALLFPLSLGSLWSAIIAVNLYRTLALFVIRDGFFSGNNFSEATA